MIVDGGLPPNSDFNLDLDNLSIFAYVIYLLKHYEDCPFLMIEPLPTSS